MISSAAVGSVRVNEPQNDEERQFQAAMRQGAAMLGAVRPYCEVTNAGFPDQARFILGILAPMTMFFIMNANTIVCATGIGGWYFHKDDPNKPRNCALVGFKWAFTISSGASFFAAVVMYIVAELKKQAKSLRG